MDLFSQLSVIEEDKNRLESINRLQEAFDEVGSSYANEYNTALSNALDHVKSKMKSKMKSNIKMREAVDNYVRNYVILEKRTEASEALYNMLAAELLQTFQALSHTSCVIS